MNILITGCNGQLGNEMQLLEKDNPQHQWFNTDVQELDITDVDAIRSFVQEHQIDGDQPFPQGRITFCIFACFISLIDWLH